MIMNSQPHTYATRTYTSSLHCTRRCFSLLARCSTRMSMHAGESVHGSGEFLSGLFQNHSSPRLGAWAGGTRRPSVDNFRPGGDAWRCGADGRAAADDSLLHRRPSGYPLSRSARLEMGARARHVARFTGCAGEYAHPKIQRCCLHRTLCASSVSVCGPQAPC